MPKPDPIAAAVGAIVDAGELPGAVMLVWRGGKVVQSGIGLGVYSAITDFHALASALPG